MAAICLAIFALARPQRSLTEEKVNGEGIDIMLAMDVSSSMLSRDFDPDRLSVSKAVASSFIRKRPYDRIGLVVFSGEAFTQCPLTTDKQMLDDLLSGLEVGVLEDGTAIGMGLAAAANRMKTSEMKSKIIILLTDGVNNAGYIDPITATQMAVDLGIKVYTIAVGQSGMAPSPVGRGPDGEFVFRMAPVEIDTELLQKISSMTNGKYYRATDVESLQTIYDDIDQLEKTDIEITVFKRYKDLFPGFLMASMVLFLLGWAGRMTLFRPMER
jgi:Ca-activated chloride channel family protein